MDAAEFNAIADRYGAPAEEREYELRCAEWDLEHLPKTVHGRNRYRIAADAPDRVPRPTGAFSGGGQAHRPVLGV